MAVTIVLQREIHANTRRTRITFQGLVNDRLAAIKCYRKPAYGLYHWIRAQHRGKRIRCAGAPVPEVIYSGWLSAHRCFCFATVFLQNYKPLRTVLVEETSRSAQEAHIQKLGRMIAQIHKKGIEQPDGNLTNFMLGESGHLAMVDEDDMRVYSRSVESGVAIINLANIASRLSDEGLVASLEAAYLADSSSNIRKAWDHHLFLTNVARSRSALEAKRSKRNISAVRRFD